MPLYSVFRRIQSRRGGGGAFTGRFFHEAALKARRDVRHRCFCPRLFVFLSLARALGGLRGTSVVGHGSGMKRPNGNGLLCTKLTKMSSIPCAKQLRSRGRERLVALRRAMWSSGNSSNVLHGRLASASPPTLTTHKVATAIANHSRLARAGSVILV